MRSGSGGAIGSETRRHVFETVMWTEVGSLPTDTLAYERKSMR
jgi:hypothetical protein